MYTNHSKKKRIISMLCTYVGAIYFMSWKKTNLFTDASYLICMVFCVAKNKECSLRMFHIWLVRLFMSRTIISWVYWHSIWLVWSFVWQKTMNWVYWYSWFVWLFMSQRIINLLYWPLHTVKRVTDREALETKEETEENYIDLGGWKKRVDKVFTTCWQRVYNVLTWIQQQQKLKEIFY